MFIDDKSTFISHFLKQVTDHAEKTVFIFLANGEKEKKDLPIKNSIIKRVLY